MRVMQQCPDKIQAKKREQAKVRGGGWRGAERERGWILERQDVTRSCLPSPLESSEALKWHKAVSQYVFFFLLRVYSFHHTL